MALRKVARDIFDDEWRSFLNEWESFKNTTELPEDSVNRYLLSCFEGRAKIVEKNEQDVFAAIKKLAVVSMTICTLQSEVVQMRQEHTEPLRHFAASVRGKAISGKFKESVT